MQICAFPYVYWSECQVFRWGRGRKAIFRPFVDRKTQFGFCTGHLLWLENAILSVLIEGREIAVS